MIDLAKIEWHGHHIVEYDTGDDCDFGPYRSYRFADGWLMYTYDEDLTRISFEKDTAV